jgi:hypothetical protein
VQPPIEEPVQRRIEDVLPAWRRHIAPTLAKGLDALARPPERGEVRVGPAEAAAPAPDPRAELRERVVPACIEWLGQQGHWLNPAADLARVRAEVQSAVSQLPAPAEGAAEAVEVPPHAWALPAALGAALGALALSPLTWLWLENRQVGLLVGGVLGAYALVRGLAALAARPRLRAVLNAALATAGAAGLAAGVWRAVRGRPAGLLRDALCLAGAWLLLASVRPRRAAPAPAERAALRVRLERQLSSGADLVLAFCWSHPDRLPCPEQAVAQAGGPLAQPAYAALAELHAELAGGGPPDGLCDGLRELFQRLEEDGFEWKSVPRGAAYDEAMREEFDALGLIRPGQAVRTRRAALRHRGRVVHKGELRRA